MRQLRQLDYACIKGERIFWETIRGERFEGVISEWDSNVAIVTLDDGTTKAIEC